MLDQVCTVKEPRPENVMDQARNLLDQDQKIYGLDPEHYGPSPEPPWTRTGQLMEPIQMVPRLGLDQAQTIYRTGPEELWESLAQYRHLWENMLPLWEVMRLMGRSLR